jgi:hypothetical protein
MLADSETQQSQAVSDGDRLVKHDTNHSPPINSRMGLCIVSSTLWEIKNRILAHGRIFGKFFRSDHAEMSDPH